MRLKVVSVDARKGQFDFANYSLAPLHDIGKMGREKLVSDLYL